MNQQLYEIAKAACAALCDKAGLQQGDILVVGCSSSEVAGGVIGTNSDEHVAAAVFSGIYDELNSRGVYLAAQCCEHLNRALIVERAVAKRERLPLVNAVPQKKAGGSFATAAYHAFTDPVAVEHIRADAGMDIGDTLIGMHLKEVAVPLRLEIGQIGAAHLVCARTRPKYIGGERAVYDDRLR